MPETATPVLRAGPSSSHAGPDPLTQAHREEAARVTSYFRCPRAEDRTPVTTLSLLGSPSSSLLGGTRDGWMDGCPTYRLHPPSRTESSGLNPGPALPETDCGELETWFIRLYKVWAGPKGSFVPASSLCRA